MTIYYYETANGHGQFETNSESDAIQQGHLLDALIVYRENEDSEDGLPFDVVLEKDK